MNTTLIFAAVAVALSAGQALAESEGNGDPFRYQAAPQVTSGHPFTTETMSSAYPELTGEVTAESSLAQIEPTLSREALVQTASSMPYHVGAGAVALAQMQGQARLYQTTGTVSSRR